MNKHVLLKTSVALAAALCAATASAQRAKLDAALSDLLDAAATKAAMASRVTTKSVKAKSATLSTSSTAVESEMTASTAELAQYDANGRVLVDIYLGAGTNIDAFVSQLKGMDAVVTGVNPSFRHGAVSAFVQPSSVEALTGQANLRLMKMAMRPMTNAGLVLSQGATVMRSPTVNAAGFTGAGITVGVLSDSYDGSPTSFTPIRAANDIANGELKPPKFVIDFVAATATDEGRAMMQIVQDVAPGADQCFATAFTGEAGFAANIRELRTNPACRADVIVDDVFYFAEPFYSDGQIAQAVNDVSLSETLPGKKVAYFSSAGNQGGLGGRGSVDVPAAVFSTSPTGLGNINLATAATCASSPSAGSTKANVAGGWLTFPNGTQVLPVNYNATGSTLVMQWDDPFYASKVTTDLNFYLFNSAGNCVFSFASNNISSDAAAEIVGLSGGASGAYRVMVGRTNAGTNKATRVRLVNLRGWSGASWATGNSPVTWGHSAAAMSNSVAAYRYTSPATQTSPFIPALEAFTSPGPVTIAFDAAGNRLAVAEVRKKPDFAAPDGADTTFFFPGQDYEGNGVPNFFGTSAAAPHAAGVAALLLQKAGGPGSLTPKQIKSIMSTTTVPRVPPFTSGTPSRAWNPFDGFGMVDAVNAAAKLP